MAQLQQITLLEEGMLHGPQWRHWRGGMLLLLLLLLAEAIWIGVLAGEREQLDGGLAALRQQQSVQKEGIERLQKRIESRKKEVSDIEQRISNLKGEQLRLQEMIAIVERKNRLSRSGFSPLLESLAYSSEEGAYLTEFHLLQGGRRLELVGSAVEAERVPRYVNRLAAQPPFGESRVEQLQLLHTLDTATEDGAETGGDEHGWYGFRVDMVRGGREEAP